MAEKKFDKTKPASWKDQTLAWRIDFVVRIVLLALWFVLVNYLDFTLGIFVNDLGTAASLTLFLFPFALYPLIFEITLNGQSPGKCAQHLRILRTNGEKPRFWQFFMRWFLSPFDWVTLGVVSLLFIKGQRGRRLGDLIAGTKIIEIAPPAQPEHQIANFKKRLLAALIDLSVAAAITLVALPIVTTHTNSTQILPLNQFLLFFLIFETVMRGQTPGKRAMNLRVQTINKAKPGFGKTLIRWLFRPVDWFYIAACFLMAKKDMRHRRVGDLVAGTFVADCSDEAAAEALTAADESRPAAPESLLAGIAEASKNARTIYLQYIAVISYCVLTIVSTSDRRMVLGEPAKLPILNLDVALDGFFVFAPIVCIFIFVYFQLYLHKLKRLFDELRMNHAKPKNHEIYPWLLNFARDEDAPGFVARAQRIWTAFSLWWSLPLVLSLFPLWYIKKHVFGLMYYLGLLPMLGVLLVVAFWRNHQHGKTTKRRFIPALAGDKMTAALFIFTSVLTIYIFAVFMPFAQRGQAWLLPSWPSMDLSYQKLVKEENVQYKTLYWAGLANAQLQGANLQGAVLQQADLRGANLQRANLKDADLSRVNLIGADLRYANLTGALLDSAQVDDSTNFEFADLSGASLRKISSLRHGRLKGAVLHEAKLGGTDLTGADLRLANFYTAVLEDSFGTAIMDSVKVFAWQQQLAPEKFHGFVIDTTLGLRFTPDDSLSDEEVSAMILRRDFFDNRKNKAGKGVENKFELIQNQGVNLVVDYTTGLMWQQAGSSDFADYENAIQYLQSLNANRYGGYGDWRFPTLEEAMSLMETQRKNGILYIDPIFDDAQRWIWTADKASSGAWNVYFYGGYCFRYSLTNVSDVRAVR